jgi:hypothetical protein
MRVDVKPEVFIGRPAAEVAAFMFDPRNDPLWTQGVVSSRPDSEGRLRNGTRVDREVKFLGRQFGYQYVVVDASGDEFVEMRVTDPFPMHIRYELTPSGNGTIARIWARGDASGFFRLVGPLMGFFVRRNIQRDLTALKRAVEP